MTKSRKVLHLSDTSLSGSPVRISKLISKYSHTWDSTHVVWEARTGYREFETDIVGKSCDPDRLRNIIEEADFIHYHNRWRRQEIFKKLGMVPPKKPSVIQIHSPRYEKDERFDDEARSGVPIAVVAQYQVREWESDLTYVVPNVVDIWAPEYQRVQPAKRAVPVVSYAPSNCNIRGWNDKGYDVTAPILKRLNLDHIINYQLIVKQPHGLAMAKKKLADIGIDEIVTGSYHLSSLEYLSLGIPCYANIDEKTESVVKTLTGCTELPWIKAGPQTFKTSLINLVKSGEWAEMGANSRLWMENYWNPERLVNEYTSMYEELL